MTKILCGYFEKSFLDWEKMASRKILRHLLHANVFMFILLISNHTLFLVQFGINLQFWVFQNAKIALAEAALAISAFWKTYSWKLIQNWTRNRITYTHYITLIFINFSLKLLTRSEEGDSRPCKQDKNWFSKLGSNSASQRANLKRLLFIQNESNIELNIINWLSVRNNSKSWLSGLLWKPRLPSQKQVTAVCHVSGGLN